MLSPTMLELRDPHIGSEPRMQDVGNAPPPCVPTPPALQILGLRVHMVQIPEVVTTMTHWVTSEHGRTHWVVVADMHGVNEARKDPQFRAIIETADLIVPDGISLVFVARYRGVPLRKRVSGTDLMHAYFHATQSSGTRHFFLGDTDQTLAGLRTNLHSQYPRLQIVGSYSPPFRPLTADEDDEILRRVHSAKPDVLWVGLGLPKQEWWIYEHRDRLQVPLVVGVGAAFKFLAGRVKRAPAWIGDHGLEWAWRLAQEPRRIGRRVMVEGTQFLGHIALELSGLRKYS